MENGNAPLDQSSMIFLAKQLSEIYNNELKNSWQTKEAKLKARGRSAMEIKWRKDRAAYRLFKKHYMYNLFYIIEKAVNEEIHKRLNEDYFKNFADIKNIKLGDKYNAQQRFPW